MTDLYKTMMEAQDAERKAGDAMIEARRAYYSALDDFAKPPYKCWNSDGVTLDILCDTFYQAVDDHDRAHKAATEALLAWLKTVT